MQFITREQELTNIVNELAGSDNLRKAMARQKVNYTKVVRGAKTQYILRGHGITNKIIVTL